MNVASLELCKELFELSGWNDTESILRQYAFATEPIRFDRPADGTEVHVLSGDLTWELPYYDLGYLLRKLPQGSCTGSTDERGTFYAWFQDDFKEHRLEADTPEDCTAQLAIELFKQGILTKEDIR